MYDIIYIIYHDAHSKIQLVGELEGLQWSLAWWIEGILDQSFKKYEKSTRPAFFGTRTRRDVQQNTHTFPRFKLRLNKCLGMTHSWGAQDWSTLGLMPSGPETLSTLLSWSPVMVSGLEVSLLWGNCWSKRSLWGYMLNIMKTVRLSGAADVTIYLLTAQLVTSDGTHTTPDFRSVIWKPQLDLPPTGLFSLSNMYCCFWILFTVFMPPDLYIVFLSIRSALMSTACLWLTADSFDQNRAVHTEDDVLCQTVSVFSIPQLSTLLEMYLLYLKWSPPECLKGG